MEEQRPGLNLQRLLQLTRAALDRCRLDLRGCVVLTEAASGAYVVTPVLAAMAGSDRVYAVTRSTRYGTAEEIKNLTVELARRAGVDNRIEFVSEKSAAVLSQADIITNSGHVRPIDANTVGWMKPTAVIPLMYETWELRPDDVDVGACRRRGIALAGTNERHPAVDVFSFLGPMAVKQLMDAGVAVYAGNILLLCDNLFAPFIERGLAANGARVDTCRRVSDAPSGIVYDAVLVALQPQPQPVLSALDAAAIATGMGGAVVVQFWGDIERDKFHAAGIPLWPPAAPARGHMGILPSGVGPDPVVRLQCGGLKVGEVLFRGSTSAEDLAFVQPVVAPGFPRKEIPSRFQCVL